jgi:hypothetical protein
MGTRRRGEHQTLRKALVSAVVARWRPAQTLARGDGDTPKSDGAEKHGALADVSLEHDPGPLDPEHPAGATVTMDRDPGASDHLKVRRA